MSNTYLVFQLYGPLAAWGDLAVGRQRTTLPHPTKSAVLGLCAAALGIRRTEVSQLQDLYANCHFASMVQAAGTLLTDFQTTDVGLDHPFLSYKDYRSDSLATACLWSAGRNSFSLDQLKEALVRPRFHLYLGRLSCPLGLPLAPQIMTAASPTDAMRRATLPGTELLSGIDRDPSRVYRWEGSSPDVPVQQQVLRRDQPLHPIRRQFAERLENVSSEPQDGEVRDA